MRTKRTIEIAAYALFIALILVLPLFMGEFWMNRIAKYLVLRMLGVAICLSWGYAGILNLGQGLFFGLGAYMMAMSLKLASNTSMQQGSDTPDPRLHVLERRAGRQIQDLCCITKASFLWTPFQSQWFGLAMAIVVPTVPWPRWSAGSCSASASRACSSRSSHWRWCCWCASSSSTSSRSPTASTA